MTVWEFLKEMPKNNVLIERKSLQVQEMESSLIYKGMINDNVGFSGTPDVQQRNKALADWITLKDELNEGIIELVQRKRKVMFMINMLPTARMIDVFYRRYMENMRWEDIAAFMGVTVQWCHKLHKLGLRELAKRFPEFDDSPKSN